jgi:hypothetical protein
VRAGVVGGRCTHTAPLHLMVGGFDGDFPLLAAGAAGKPSLVHFTVVTMERSAVLQIQQVPSSELEHTHDFDGWAQRDLTGPPWALTVPCLLTFHSPDSLLRVQT